MAFYRCFIAVVERVTTVRSGESRSIRIVPFYLEGAEADVRTDIFALGAVIYEMATGRKAFAGKSHASVISAPAHVEVAWVVDGVEFAYARFDVTAIDYNVAG